jgi:hypothetical protein
MSGNMCYLCPRSIQTQEGGPLRSDDFLSNPRCAFLHSFCGGTYRSLVQKLFESFARLPASISCAKG